jgi:hypothetical protein
VPLHDALGPKRALKGDKRTCQMDPPNCDEALREVDLDEGSAPRAFAYGDGLSHQESVRTGISVLSLSGRSAGSVPELIRSARR